MKETKEKEEGVSPVINSGILFQGHKYIRIVHNDEIYILRITRSDKLILTK